MTENYKLCPKCNNPLDLNETSCPYCGESLGISFGGNQIKGNGIKLNQFQSHKLSDHKAVKLYKLFLIFFIVIPIISSVISFVVGLISEIFENL